MSQNAALLAGSGGSSRRKRSVVSVDAAPISTDQVRIRDFGGESMVTKVYVEKSHRIIVNSEHCEICIFRTLWSVWSLNDVQCDQCPQCVVSVVSVVTVVTVVLHVLRSSPSSLAMPPSSPASPTATSPPATRPSSSRQLTASWVVCVVPSSQSESLPSSPWQRSLWCAPP